jgi:hypothetical protein
MKTILKTLPKDLEMRYDLKFGSEENTEVLRQVIPRLVAALKKYNTSYKKIKEWLSALHKHRRVRLLYSRRGTLDRDNRRLHKNNRTNEVNKSIFFLNELQLTFGINIEKGTTN